VRIALKDLTAVETVDANGLQQVRGGAYDAFMPAPAFLKLQDGMTLNFLKLDGISSPTVNPAIKIQY
jgi:hypothetical protein